MNTVGSKFNEIDLLLFKSGDEKTFEVIFDANYEAIVGFCTQFIPDVDASKSIAQQAFINLWLNRYKVERVSGIRAFLYTAAKTGCLNYLRHEKYKMHYEKKATAEKENRLNQEILQSFQFNRLEYIELEEMIQAAIEKLPEKCRVVFIKSRFEGKKNKEIAEELGIAVKSVESNITRALKILREELKDVLPLVLFLL
ncbi:RNA polymerase sigma-70 factor [Prolixibacteraceae bacterium Z1-6]|uniref:RNA polymerase sigma-70 factor n=1 Tax=Draconibacterium aestuarii TaxID=2998507 RepID=A0A9X3FB94_9BACT|nr:RNA polymerase sigma-70 factor [Prolixibacteraceae bacterium Z1-6]